MYRHMIIFVLCAHVYGQDDVSSIIEDIFKRVPLSDRPNITTIAPTTGRTTEITIEDAVTTSTTDIRTSSFGPIIDKILPSITKTSVRTSDSTTERIANKTAATNPVTEPATCFDDKRKIGKCIKATLCRNPNYSEGIIDPVVPDYSCTNYQDVCCLLTDVITLKPNTNEGCGWRDALNYPDLGLTYETRFGEFPWVTAILENETDNKTVYIGTGSLIHPNVVLTAAHIPKDKKLKIRAGVWNSVENDEAYPHQEREVKEVIMHKDFNKGNLFYDIALLFLSTPVDPAPHIRYACLPPQGLSPDSGTRCFTTGWGKQNFASKTLYSNRLAKLEVPVVDRRSCLLALRKTRLGSVFELHTSFMCAGGEADKDNCLNDGGAPLVCPIEDEPGRYVQTGIAAWTIGCGNSTPGVYVDVTKLRTWIDDKVKGRGYSINIYSYTV